MEVTQGTRKIMNLTQIAWENEYKLGIYEASSMLGTEGVTLGASPAHAWYGAKLT